MKLENGEKAKKLLGELEELIEFMGFVGFDFQKDVEVRTSARIVLSCVIFSNTRVCDFQRTTKSLTNGICLAIAKRIKEINEELESL